MGRSKEVIRLIPGLENVDIVRYGVMHRNTFINSPDVLNEKYELIKKIEFNLQVK